jgi:kynurenine formamidase
VDGVKPKLVGEYDVDRFVGNVAILDFRHKMNAVRRYFNDDGIINIDVSDPAPWGSFIDTFKSLEVSLQELMAALNEFRLESLKGVLFLCGNAGYWKPGKYLAHQYIYFYNIYLTEEAVRWLAKQEIAFVGIDAFQLEDPIINFRGDEAFVARDPSLRRFLLAKLEAKTLFCNHSTLLSNDIVIYENLNLSESLAGKKGWFSGAPLNLQLPGVNDNGLCRPVLTTERSDR